MQESEKACQTIPLNPHSVTKMTGVTSRFFLFELFAFALYQKCSPVLREERQLSQ